MVVLLSVHLDCGDNYRVADVASGRVTPGPESLLLSALGSALMSRHQRKIGVKLYLCFGDCFWKTCFGTCGGAGLYFSSQETRQEDCKTCSGLDHIVRPWVPSPRAKQSKTTPRDNVKETNLAPKTGKKTCPSLMADPLAGTSTTQ